MHFKTLMMAAALIAALPLAASGQGAAQPRPMFQALDENRDGAVDRSEIGAMRARMFERIDADGNGQITAAERAEARERMRQRIAEALALAIRLGGQLSEERQARLAQADLNGDGQLSRAEFLGADTPLFTRADLDGDGRVTLAEWSGAAERIRARK